MSQFKKETLIQLSVNNAVEKNILKNSNKTIKMFKKNWSIIVFKVG